MSLAKLHSPTRRQAASPYTKVREDQVRNTDGAYVFSISQWDMLDRFLILGSESNNFGVNERNLTKAHAQNVLRLIKSDGVKVVNRIVEISKAGRAAKNDYALYAFALCIAEGDEQTRCHAYARLPEVARIGTHLFMLADFLKAMDKGWGKGLRKAFGRWYTGKDYDRLQLQAIKYKQREGWSHRDILRLAHPTAVDRKQNAILHYMVEGVVPGRFALHQLRAHASLNENSTEAQVIKAIVDHRLPREAIPTKFLNSPNVWDALLQEMPVIALVRNLGKMTSVGLLVPGNDATKLVRSKLADAEAVRRSRIHPMNVLIALNTYTNGHGVRGNLRWSPLKSIHESLDDLFYTSFGNVEPTGKRTLIALDMSGSMSAPISGFDPNSGRYGQQAGRFAQPISCAEAAAAMSMVTARVEDPDSYEIMGFSHGIKRLAINPRMYLKDVMTITAFKTYGGTDCSLPMQYAMQEGLLVDTFVVYTDNETNSGRIQPFQALRQYRQHTGIPAKLVVVGLWGSPFTIADPSDAGMLDVVGFDAGAPAIISDFARATMRKG